MKITAILILVGCLQVSAKTYSQITLQEKNASLLKVFKEIKTQSGYDFLYNTELLEMAGPVTVNLKDVTLQEALDACLEGKSLSYTIEEKTVVVKPDAKKILDEVFPPPPITVHGHLVNEDGAPVTGATIAVKGSDNSVSTDADGNFTLDNVDNNAILVITATNIETITVAVNGRKNLNLTAKVKVSPLDEVQIIAYGTTSQRLATGNVTTITSKEIEKQPVSNPLLALKDRVPGLIIRQLSGVPGTGISVQVQGTNSMFHGNDPLYVIDGVPYPSEPLPDDEMGSIFGHSGNNGSPSGPGSTLSFINPDDIESISVLKGADATSIYGSQAANGAVIITTKKGIAGPTKLDLNAQNGWGHVSRTMDMMNIQEYMQMRKEAIRNDGLTIGANDFDINGVWDTTRNINWQKALIDNAAKYSNVNLTISGGNATTQFLVEGTYNLQGTVFLNPGNFSDVKGDVHFNLNNVSVNKKFKIGITGTYMIDNNMLPQVDLTQAALRLAPDYPDLFNKDGSINWGTDSSFASIVSNNPAANLANTYVNKTYNLISHADISYEVLKGLEIKSSFGYNNLQTNETQLYPLSALPPLSRSMFPPSSQYGNENNNSWIIQPQATFKRAIGKNGIVNALIGATIERRNSTGYQIFGSGYSSDAVLNDINSAAILNARSMGSDDAIYNYSSIYGRINYNWNNKYIVDLTANRDGSSRFGPANEFHDFGSVAGAWIFSSEKFIKNNLPFLSFGKLRTSYGTTGNDQIGDYTFLTLYSATFNYGAPYQGQVGLQPGGLANPFIQWELTKKMEFGLDLGFLKDRILLHANYGINRSSHQLLTTPLPILTGFGGVPANLPWTIQNTDWEITLNTVNIQTANFRWSSNFNITIPQIGRWVGGPGLSKSSPSYNQPLNMTLVPHLIGVNDTTGLYEFATAKGGSTYNPTYGVDNIIPIRLDPKFYGGLGNTFTFKGFELEFFFDFTKKIGQNYQYEGASYDPGTFQNGYNNQPALLLNRWQKPGDKKPIQRYNSDFGFGNEVFMAALSDASYTDASYIRLQNLSLSWQLPDRWTKTVHLQNARLYAQGQNLFIFTHYIGMDPENGSVSSLPPLKVLTVGVQVVL